MLVTLFFMQLAPVSLSDFNRIAVSKKENSIDGKKKVNQTGPTVKKNIATLPNNNKSIPDDERTSQHEKPSKAKELGDIGRNLGVDENRLENLIKIAAEAAEDIDDDEDLEDNDEEEEEESKDLPRDISPEMIGPNISLFDNIKFESCDECILYMAKEFGFFIPDQEYLTDLNGFLQYLSEKIKIGHLCIYCQKQFSTAQGCQNHMINKSHCKIAYEEEIDLDEFEDFYDFSSSYTEDMIDGCSDEDNNLVNKTLQISSIGELILLDGRIAGHRDYVRYYKQKFRKEDTRPEVIAQKKEELLRISTRLGMNGVDSLDLQRMTDAEVVDLMLRKRRDLRKSQIIEQRARQKYEFVVQRREYQSRVAKLRSSATTTAKIRDWHRKL